MSNTVISRIGLSQIIKNDTIRAITVASAKLLFERFISSQKIGFQHSRIKFVVLHGTCAPYLWPFLNPARERIS